MILLMFEQWKEAVKVFVEQLMTLFPFLLQGIIFLDSLLVNNILKAEEREVIFKMMLLSKNSFFKWLFFGVNFLKLIKLVDVYIKNRFSFSMFHNFIFHLILLNIGSACTSKLFLIEAMRMQEFWFVQFIFISNVDW